MILKLLLPLPLSCLNPPQKTNICYLSFPDSNSGCMGDTRFHFRTRLCPIKREMNPLHEQFNKESLLANQARSR